MLWTTPLGCGGPELLRVSGSLSAGTGSFERSLLHGARVGNPEVDPMNQGDLRQGNRQNIDDGQMQACDIIKEMRLRCLDYCAARLKRNAQFSYVDT